VHDAFVACICEQLKRLDVCSSAEEYECTSEAVVSSLSAPVGHQVGAPPSEGDLDNVTQELSEYFEDISLDDAKRLIYAAAYEAWGDSVAHITVAKDNKSEDDIQIDDKKDNEINSDDDDNNGGDDDDDNDGGYIGDGECELCEREIKLTRHHLIPKTTWPRMKKRLWNSAPLIQSLHSLSSLIADTESVQKQQEMQEQQRILQEKLTKLLGTSNLDSLPTNITHDTVRSHLSQVCHLCRQCHSAVHRIHTEWELAMDFNTMERLYESEEVMKFGRWANKQRRSGKSI